MAYEYHIMAYFSNVCARGLMDFIEFSVSQVTVMPFILNVDEVHGLSCR